jgi:hypothetical protein
MTMSPEIIIGIVGLVVAFPPIMYTVWRLIGCRRSEALPEAGKNEIR